MLKKFQIHRQRMGGCEQTLSLKILWQVRSANTIVYSRFLSVVKDAVTRGRARFQDACWCQMLEVLLPNIEHVITWY
jgi:hypothetical protein